MNEDDPKTCKLTAVKDAQERQGIGRQWISRQPAGWILITGAYLLGGGGMLAWVVFLMVGPHSFLVCDLSSVGRLGIDALLCLTFFIQHSVMVRRGFRLWLTRRVNIDFHGALYATAAGTCLLALVLLWQPAGSPLWEAPDWVRGLMMALFFAAGIGALWGATSLEAFDALGIRPALHALDGSAHDTPMTFSIRGPYRWVRHPLYLFSLTIIWMGPVFTADRLLHNALWTIWIVIGARLEERDLAVCFGDPYRAYQARVPMLLPRSLKPRLPDDRHDPQ